MRKNHRRLSWLWIAVLLTSCASADKLARRSELALRGGDPDKAYREAVTAVRREPRNPRALAALGAAGEALADDWKQRIHRLADVDTLAAARQALAFRDFRLEVIRYGGTLEPDTLFATFELGIRTAAAAMLYAEADADLGAGRPKSAYAGFCAAREYAPGFRDVERRIDDAYERAVQRVAILPVENQTGVPDLSRVLAEQIWDGVQRETDPRQLKFTRLIGPPQVFERMTVSELDELSREQAIRLGRRIGADRVVWGRVFGSHTDTDTDTDRYHDTIFRRRMERDSSGRTRERFEPVDFSAVERTRHVSVSWEIEVLDVNEEASLAHHANTVEAAARTVHTSYAPEGDCDDYCLVPPSIRSADPERAKRVDERWQGTFGTWTVPRLLETARRDHERRLRFADVRGQFHRDTRNLPVYLDDLPGEGDLLLLALGDLWRPVFAALKEQDDR